ncbi:alpha/beta fold hydrolase [Aestuariivirga sp.]|uniref:alpha/beta fold hydrolase n=1 Tax=Aestuariivirga sp. TaxID=2650926 RepID=UPI003BAB264E
MPLFHGSSSAIHYEQTRAGPDIVWVGGGGTQGKDWQRFQTPHFDRSFRSTVFDNRGIGLTVCRAPLPWPIEDFASDLAELVRGVCAGPVNFVGTSLGSAIVQQLAIDSPELVRCAVVMGSGAWSTGWGWDYQQAEIEFRNGGGKLDGLMGVTHYASMLYPACALGDRELWPRLKSLLMEWMDSGENETSLVSQWDASLRFDQRSALAGVKVPVHVIAFEEDVQAPPQDGAELARLMPGSVLHEMKGMGHGSWYGHAHDEINALVEEIFRQHA